MCGGARGGATFVLVSPLDERSWCLRPPPAAYRTFNTAEYSERSCCCISTRSHRHRGVWYFPDTRPDSHCMRTIRFECVKCHVFAHVNGRCTLWL